MSDEIKSVIRNEVSVHESGMDNHHVDTITDAIYKQLVEYMGEDGLSKLIQEMKSDFIELVDNLIPFVEEYEVKIDKILDEKMALIVKKTRES